MTIDGLFAGEATPVAPKHQGFEARWYQQEAVASWWSFFAARKGNPLILMPTGSGKSPVLGMLVKDILTKYPRQRILVLTHVKELVEQDAKAILRHWPHAPLTVYSASVGKKDHSGGIVVASIQSIANALDDCGIFNLIIIDEAHLVPEKADTQYRSVIATLKERYKHLTVTGLTATPYRLQGGHLLDCGIFTDVCYDLTTPDSFSRLISEGYLSRLVNKKVVNKVDTSQIRMRGGDYIESELQAALDQQDITSAAVKEVMTYGADRKHVLVFTTGVEHAQHVADEFTLRGWPATVVHGGLPKKERERRLAAYKAGEYRVCVNVNVLTTGFDFPGIDLIVVLRPTESVSLWIQILGRGLRVEEGKENCLVMDFTENSYRIGPIDDPDIPDRKKQKKSGSRAAARVGGIECPACGELNPQSHVLCRNCGEVLPEPEEQPAPNKEFAAYGMTASEYELMTDGTPIVKDFGITMVNYALFSKPDRPDSIKVTYHSDMRIFTDWLNFEASGSAVALAQKWWREATGGSEPPKTCMEFIGRKGELIQPKQIKVWIKRPYPQVLNRDWGEGFGQPRKV